MQRRTPPVSRPSRRASSHRQRARRAVDGPPERAHDRRMLRARLFGGLAVWVDDRPVPEIGGVKPRSLFAYLLVNAGTHPRARLAGRFWPDVLDTSARGSLRSALWTIRSALEEVGGGALLAGRPPRGGARSGCRDRGRRPRGAAASWPVATRPRCSRAVLLGAEPLLPDIPDEWVLEAQDRHRDRMIDALLALADAVGGAGGPGARPVVHAGGPVARPPARVGPPGSHAAPGGGGRPRRGALRVSALPRDARRRARHGGVRRDARPRRGDPSRHGVARATCPAYGRFCAGVQLAEDSGFNRTGTGDGPPRPGSAGMVGRGAELARCRAAWERASVGRGGVLLIEGPAGVGKSRLAAELRADGRGLGRARGRRSRPRHRRATPLRPVGRRPAAAGARQRRRPPARCSGPRTSPGSARRWRPPGAAARRRRPPSPRSGRRASSRPSPRRSSGARAARPLLVVLEDLHRADPSSLGAAGPPRAGAAGHARCSWW